jgi:ribonuclease P protein component
VGTQPLAIKQINLERETRYTLGKNERLKKRVYIEELFTSGESFSLFPLRVYYCVRHDTETTDHRPGTTEAVLQFGVGVSKKHFKKAVDRNRIKRWIKEAYRTQNKELGAVTLAKKEFCLKLFILFVGKEMPDFDLINQKVHEALKRLELKFNW